MAFRKAGAAVGRIVLVGGSFVFGAAQDVSLQAGVMHDTWEHADQGVGPGQGPVTIQSLAINPEVIAGPITANGIITLSGPAPAGGAVVQLTMQPVLPQISFIPGTQVTIPSGTNSGDFSIVHAPVFGTTPIQITATLGGSSVSKTVAFTP